MRLIGEEGVDVAVLPIGDNYTMGPDDALRAVKMLTPKVVIPMHYNTWDCNRTGRGGLDGARGGGDESACGGSAAGGVAGDGVGVCYRRGCESTGMIYRQ